MGKYETKRHRLDSHIGVVDQVSGDQITIHARKRALVVETECGHKGILQPEEIGFLLAHLDDRALAKVHAAQAAELERQQTTDVYTVQIIFPADQLSGEISHVYSVRANSEANALVFGKQFVPKGYKSNAIVKVEKRKPREHFDYDIDEDYR